jgi:hypothetical protein
MLEAIFGDQMRLTVKVTVEVFEAAASYQQINSLEGSLMIEWE